MSSSRTHLTLSASLAEVRDLPTAEANAVLEAIDEDPFLLPEAKEHFRNLYHLLRKIGTPAEGQSAARRRPMAARYQGEAEPLTAEEKDQLTETARANSRRRQSPPRSKP